MEKEFLGERELRGHGVGELDREEVPLAAWPQWWLPCPVSAHREWYWYVGLVGPQEVEPLCSPGPKCSMHEAEEGRELVKAEKSALEEAGRPRGGMLWDEGSLLVGGGEGEVWPQL